MPFEEMTGSPSWLLVTCVGVEHHNGDELALDVDDGCHACDAQCIMSLRVTQLGCLLVMSRRIQFFRLFMNCPVTVSYCVTLFYGEWLINMILIDVVNYYD